MSRTRFLEPKPVQKPRPPVRHRKCTAQAGGVARTLRRGGPRLRYDRKDPCPALATCPRCGRAAAKRERLAARGPLRGFVGTVSEAIDLIRAIPGRRRRLADQCRSTERRRDPRALRLRCHAALCLT